MTQYAGLHKRILTGIALVFLLLALVQWASVTMFGVFGLIIFVAASWETARLFQHQRPVLVAAGASVLFIMVLLIGLSSDAISLWLLGFCSLFWLIAVPIFLKKGLPLAGSRASHYLHIAYQVAVAGSILAMVLFFRASPFYLLSTWAIVWIADTGAYFGGKVFGKHKLALTISPGKSWEGAIAGCLLVLLVANGLIFFPGAPHHFFMDWCKQWGWIIWMLVLLGLVAISIVGDLFESQLKRRVNVKDSSDLLPGHGGVLDRMDSTIAMMPMMAWVYTLIK